jgi:hypothetical protein
VKTLDFDRGIKTDRKEFGEGTETGKGIPVLSEVHILFVDFGLGRVEAS